MTYLVAGIALFIGGHSIRIVAPAWRTRFIAQHGNVAWQMLYGTLSLASLALMIYGFGLSRADPVFVWNPPLWTRHVALPLTLLAFILFAAAGGRPNHFNHKIGHPMYAGVKVWAFAHLLANGRLGDMLLFGSLLLWAIAGFAISRRRDRHAGLAYPAAIPRNTAISVLVGCSAWVIFVFWLHRLLIGVPPI